MNPGLRALPALAALAALAPAGSGAAAQEPTAAPTPATPAAPVYQPPRLAISVTAGLLRFGDIQTQAVRAERLDAEGAVTETEALRRTLEGESQVTAGVSALLGVARAWAVRAGVWWGRGSIAARYGGPEAFADEAQALTGGRETALSLVGAEAALRFRMSSARRLQPYAEVGLAGVWWEGRGSGGPGATGLEAPVRRWAPLAALGAVVPLREGLTARVQATTHLQRSPLGPVPSGRLVAESDTFRLTFADPERGPFADAALELTRTLRLEAGLSLELGAAPGPARPRSGSGAP